MLRFLALAAAGAGLMAMAGSGAAAQGALDGIGRTIAKEPKYTAAPRYALLVLGTKARSKVWMVEDGKTLYVDANGNGDLTDDGLPLSPVNVREWGTAGNQSWDFDYVLKELALEDGSRHADFSLVRWNYGEKQDGYGLSLKLDGQTPMYAGWTAFWAASPREAQVIHFGGPLRPRLLRSKEFVVESQARRFSLAFINPGSGEAAHSRLSIEALPASVLPKVRIDWPVAEGTPPLQTSFALTERCCYWEFYNLNFQVPQRAVAGMATVTVLLPDGAFPFELATDRIEVPVRDKATP